MRHKSIPLALQNHILPFNWDVGKVWALEADTVWMNITQLTYLLELPLWSSTRHQGLLFDISPMSVILDPSSCPHQFNRLQQAQLHYPIDMLRFQEKLWILDGVHRIAKHVIAGTLKLRVRVHDEAAVPLIQP